MCNIQFDWLLQITIDTSPPHAGVVKDNTPGNADLDYQQSMTLEASWEGFFDKQSGVLFYQYGFSDVCLEAADFSIPESPGVRKVTSDNVADINNFL